MTRVEDGMKCRIDEKDTVASMVGRIERQSKMSEHSEWNRSTDDILYVVM